MKSLMPPAAVIATWVARPTEPRSQASRFDRQAPSRTKTKLRQAITLARKTRLGAATGANVSDIRDRLGYHVDFVDKGIVVMFAGRPSPMLKSAGTTFRPPDLDG